MKIVKIQVLKPDIQVNIMQELVFSPRNQAVEVVYQAQVLFLGVSPADSHFHAYVVTGFELLVDLHKGEICWHQAVKWKFILKIRILKSYLVLMSSPRHPELLFLTVEIRAVSKYPNHRGLNSLPKRTSVVWMSSFKTHSQQ